MREPQLHVGYRSFTAIDPVQGADIPVRVLYPTRAAAQPSAFGSYLLDVAIDAPVAGERLPVIAVSHGTGGSCWGYRGLAAVLARAGFAVALLEHPGNRRTDNALADTPANLANRPRHVRLAIDAALGDALIGPHLASDRAIVIGHSLGGYTAVAVAGGHPLALPNQTPDRVAHPVAVDPDPRVRAVVLLAPALPWFMAPGALADVRVPLLVRAGERDDIMPPFYIETILRGLPADARLDYRVVPNAGHFAFLAPFPPALASPRFPPSQDPPGFDRVAYHDELAREVLAFVSAARG